MTLVVPYVIDLQKVQFENNVQQYFVYCEAGGENEWCKNFFESQTVPYLLLLVYPPK